jgi:predicted nuclease of predicted toxin-antitoxin system
MKFLADMGISPKTVSFLRDLGYDSIHLGDLGLDRSSDKDILPKARLEGPIVVTHDLDFGEIVAASRSLLPGVIIFRLRNMHPNRVNQSLQQILDRYERPLFNGAIISVTEGKIRIRTLPIG